MSNTIDIDDECFIKVFDRFESSGDMILTEDEDEQRVNAHQV